MWFDTLDSTNDEARRRMNDIDNLSVLSAENQTAGRGQRGNSWKSNAGENLMFSVVLKFREQSLQAYDQFAVSEIAALSVVDFLSEYGIVTQIKWPNDIYAGTRKICGILVENAVRGEWLASSIVGIGLNVNQRNFDISLPNPTSMVLCSSPSSHSECIPSRHSVPIYVRHSEQSEESLPSYDTHELLERFMDIFSGYCSRFLHINGGLAKLRRLYLAQLWRLGQPSRFLDYTTLPAGHLDGPVGIITSQTDKAVSQTPQPKEFTGTIRGISDIGQLMIELPDSTTRTFGFKEIGYVL